MKKIGFIGAIDKSDLIINVAKVLQILGYKVLVVDTTSTQKIKYIIPSISPTKSYITNFENIDFGVGFSSWEDIEKYLGIKFDSNEEESNEGKQKEENKKNENKNIYDYVLVDIDSKESFDGFDIVKAEKKYFLTKFDRYSLIRGISVFEGLKEPIELTKVLFSYTSYTKEDELYLNFISSYYQINWVDYELYFRISGEDNQTFEDNQRIEKIRLNKLSVGYRESLSYLVQDMSKEDSIGRIKKAMRD